MDGHLVSWSVGFCSFPLLSLLADPAATDQPPTQYLLQFESSDISWLRADVQSLGFVSLVT